MGRHVAVQTLVSAGDMLEQLSALDNTLMPLIERLEGSPRGD